MSWATRVPGELSLLVDNRNDVHSHSSRVVSFIYVPIRVSVRRNTKKTHKCALRIL